MRTFVACAAVAVVLPTCLAAQTVSVTESDLLAQLSRQSPRIQAARAPVDVARAGIVAAGRWPNPRVTLNRESVAGVAEDIVTVSQPLPITGRRRLERQAATALADARSSRADEEVRRIRADARLAFADLWAAQERERELVRTHARLTDLAGVLGKRERAGDTAGFDRMRAEREVLSVDADRSIAMTARAQAQVLLATYLAPDRDTAALEAVRPPAAPAPLPDVEALTSRAEAVRGDLIALARDLDAASFAERAAGRRAIPEPEVVGGSKTSNAAGGDAGSIVSVHVTLPLFDRGRPERMTAQAQARQAQAEAAALRQSIRAQIAVWRLAVVERRAAADRHRAALAEGAGQIERIAQVSYDAGERGVLELLDAYRTSSTARLHQVELDAAVREAEIELEFVSGWEIP